MIRHTAVSPYMKMTLIVPLMAASLSGPAQARDWPFFRSKSATTATAPPQYIPPGWVMSPAPATAAPTVYTLPPVWTYSVSPMVLNPAAPTATQGTTSGLPVAPRSFLAGSDSTNSAEPAIGAIVGAAAAREIGGLILQKLQSLRASRGGAQPAPLFKELLDQALAVFAQQTGGFQPNTADFKVIVDLVQRALTDMAAGPGGNGSTPTNLTLNASTVQVTIPANANIFLQTQGASRPSDNPPAPPSPSATETSGRGLGSSGPPAFAGP